MFSIHRLKKRLLRVSRKRTDTPARIFKLKWIFIQLFLQCKLFQLYVSQRCLILCHHVTTSGCLNGHNKSLQRVSSFRRVFKAILCYRKVSFNNRWKRSFLWKLTLYSKFPQKKLKKSKKSGHQNFAPKIELLRFTFARIYTFNELQRGGLNSDPKATKLGCFLLKSTSGQRSDSS